MDQFDFVIDWKNSRIQLEKREQWWFNHLNKTKNILLKQYKQEQKIIKEKIFNYTKNLNEDQLFLITAKNDLLIDSFFEIIKDVKDTMMDTDNIFMKKPTKDVLIFYKQRNDLINKHFYFILPHCQKSPDRKS